MSNIKLLGLTYVLFAIAIITVVVIIITKRKQKKYSTILDTLEREKNLIVSANILSELNKVESMINSKDIEKQYSEWKRRFDEIRNVDVPHLTDSLIEIEELFNTKKYKNIEHTLAKVELSIYHVKTKASYLLEEIRNLTLSEERNRETITKLKGTYRNVLSTYRENEDYYKLIKSPIELQFETIDKLFSAFEVAMEKNAYNEVAKIIKALDDSINNLDLVIDEAPEIILLGSKIIPKKMNDISMINNKMRKEGFNLDYLRVEYNITEAEKKIADVFDRLNVLNLEDSMLELKTISDYFDGIYNDFDKERLARTNFVELARNITTKTNRLLKIAINLNGRIGDIKKNYIVTNDDIKDLNILEVAIRGIGEDTDLVRDNARKKVQSYTKLYRELERINIRLTKLEDNVDSILRMVSGFRMDEERAYKQLEEIKRILWNSKEKISSYKLPVVPKIYYVELSEATEAIRNMMRILESKPLDIELLNTRVETARDLTLKLYKTTNNTIKTASMSEHAIVYGNRYRSINEKVNSGLNTAERLFFDGNFKSSLETAISALKVIDPGIYEKLLQESKN